MIKIYSNESTILSMDFYDLLLPPEVRDARKIRLGLMILSEIPDMIKILPGEEDYSTATMRTLALNGKMPLEDWFKIIQEISSNLIC